MLYSKFKANEITKALREGKAPTAGPPIASPEQPPELNMPDVPSFTGLDTNQSAPTSPPQSTSPSGGLNQSRYSPVPPISQSPSRPTPSIAQSGRGRQVTDDDDTEDEKPKHKIPAKEMEQASKACTFAASALAFQDVPTAIKELNKALSILTMPR